MSLTDSNIHPQVRIFVTMLCEGFNVPNSDARIQAFGDKLNNPNTTALKETYNIFTDGRGSTNKMPTIAEVMEVYKNVVRRQTTPNQPRIDSVPKEVDYQRSKQMFNKLQQMVKGKIPVYKHPIDHDTIGWQDGVKFTLSRNKKGQDYVHYHNHSINHRE